MDTRSLLGEVAVHAADWVEGLGERPVRADLPAPDMRITTEIGEEPVAVERVIAELVREAAPGLTATGSPRFFGFVIGGAHPAGLAADWLTAAWDQNAGAAAVAPAAAAFEAVAGRWLAELLGLPESASFALVTGSQMGHVTALAAARHGVLAAAGRRVRAVGGRQPGTVRARRGRRARRLVGDGRSQVAERPV